MGDLPSLSSLPVDSTWKVKTCPPVESPTRQKGQNCLVEISLEGLEDGFSAIEVTVSFALVSPQDAKDADEETCVPAQEQHPRRTRYTCRLER